MTKTKHGLLTTFCILLFAFCICAFGAVAASAAEPTAATISGQQVNLGGDISMKYYVTLADGTTIDQVSLQITFLGEVTTLTENTYNATYDKYVFTFTGISPQCMGDTILADLYVGETKVGETVSYSVADNLVAIYAGSNDATKQLIVDTLEYGSAAQIYRDYKTDALVKDMLVLESGEKPADTDEDKTVPENAPHGTSTDGTTTVTQANVNFSYINYLKFQFSRTPTDTVGGDVVATDNELIYITGGIAPTDFHRDYNVNSGEINLDYSINDYLYAVQQGNCSTEMKALANALYNYGLSAHIVKGNHEGGNATCAELAECTICGLKYGEYDTDNHTSTEFTYSNNGDYTHSKLYACCEAVHTASEYCTFDITTGKCGVCGADMTVIATVTDGTNTYYAANTDTLNQAVTAILEKGRTTFTVNLPAEAPAKMFTAIRRALIDTEGVEDGSIHLTLDGVTAIPDNEPINPTGAIFGDAFVDDIEVVTQLASINLPDVVTIGARAFFSCENLASVTAPKVQIIGENAFEATALTSVELPEATTIGAFAFSYCTSLTTVKLPSATSIGDYAFESITYLELTAAGNIYIHQDALGYPTTFSDNIDLVLHASKASEITDGVTWNGFTFKSITIACSDGTTNHNFTYTDNGDTHKKVCTECGYSDNEDHTLTYTAKDNIITQSCSANCGHIGTATISAEDTIYDGNAKETANVTYRGSWIGDALDVSYENNTNAGTATASITMGEATANVDFSIAKATPTENDFIFTIRDEIVNYDDFYGYDYDGNVWTAGAKVKDGIVGMGTITFSYDGSYAPPTDNGLYNVKIYVSEGDNYEEISFYVFDIQIRPKTLTEDDVTVGNLNDSYVYTGEQITPEITVTVDGKTLTKGTDYEVTYGENKYVYAAEDDGTVTITFNGNYEGTITKTFEITRDPDTKEFEGEWVNIPEE